MWSSNEQDRFAILHKQFLCTFSKNVSSSNSWCWTYRQFMCLSAAEGAAQQSKYSRVGQISGCRLASYLFLLTECLFYVLMWNTLLSGGCLVHLNNWISGMCNKLSFVKHKSKRCSKLLTCWSINEKGEQTISRYDTS